LDLMHRIQTLDPAQNPGQNPVQNQAQNLFHHPA
jgi:hypothetical protein